MLESSEEAHSKALVFFAVSKQIPIVYSADRGRAEIMTFDLYACVLVRNVFQRRADLMRIKLGLRLKKGIR